MLRSFARRGTRQRPLRSILLVELLESRDLLTTFAPSYLLARPSGAAAPMATAGPTGYTPAQVRHAYGFDQVFFNGITGNGSGQTIAIVDAFNDPNIAGDLHQFDLTFGLPDPALWRVNQTGGTALPAANTTWAIEIALDVEWAHAIAPEANILLVEANSNSNADLFAAVSFAASQSGVSVVSMSWGSPEFANESSFDATFTTPRGHAGVTFLAAPGDAGAPASFPSASPNVIGVGGTALALTPAGAWSGETGWSGGAGGAATYEAMPSYQNGVVTQTTHRASPDVAYDADPTTSFPVYDSYNNPAFAPWSQVGGTSAGTPQWAALVAIANQGRALAGLAPLDGPSQTLLALYQLPASDFHDVAAGTSEGTPHYSASPGYDLVTGRGSPLANLVIGGLVGFAAPAAVASPWVNLGGAGTALAAARNNDGSQQVFTIGTDGGLWVQTQPAGGGWGGWIGLGGLCTSLSVTTNSRGFQDVFVIGTDGAVWTRSETALGQWTAWTGLGGICTSLTVGTNIDGTVQIFAVAANGAVWTRTKNSAGQWTAWFNLGGIGRSPIVTRNVRGLLDLFVIGSDNGLWMRSQTAVGQWTGWVGLGGVCRSIAAGTNADGTEQLFAVGSDGAVWTRTETLPGQWTAWASLGGIGQAPVVTRNSRGLLDLFVVGSDGAVWTRSETSAGVWTAWTGLGGAAGALAATSDAFGRLTIFLDAPNGSLARRAQASPGVWL